MKHVFSTAIACIAISFLASCTSDYLQVYVVKSSLTKTENALKFSNEDCCIYYNLWNENGDLGFLFENKADQDIFLCMPQSFVIKNDIAYDYYEEGSQTKTTSSVVLASSSAMARFNGYFYGNFKWFPGSISNASSVGTSISHAMSKTSINPRVICIPAHSLKSVTGYSISAFVYKDCDDMQFTYPRSNSRTIEYEKYNSPLVFRNRIAYSFDCNCEDIRIVDNEFYVSSVTNYKRKKATTKQTFKSSYDCSYFEGEQYIVSAPDRFYNTYEGRKAPAYSPMHTVDSPKSKVPSYSVKKH